MHCNPELSMQEEKSAKYIADTLRSLGEYDIETGLGEYVVASLKVGHSCRVIGLRAAF